MAIKRANGRATVDEAISGASEKVLKQITELYEVGLGGGTPGSMGLKGISEHSLVNLPMKKPRKKVSVMIVGNHSAGKSSFINWYIGEQIQKTGVAIETRGFTFVTSGKKRETLTGDATLRFFDYLKDFSKFEGIIPNLFTEITSSKEKNFSCVDFIDTPGLVDGDMQYPFDVQEAILWMADHVDLILIFFDPIGQATCKRTMQVVEKLNNGPHLEKIHYFMSKADAVEKEHDRQRVLIQITQNLATKIRNSHAFNLPTFYLPKDSDEPCTIPNAIEDVCKEIDKAINMTVQKYMKNLKSDCETIVGRIDDVIVKDKAAKADNMKRRMKGVFLSGLFAGAFLLFLGVLAIPLLPSVCKMRSLEAACSTNYAQLLMDAQPLANEHFHLLVGVSAAFQLWLLVCLYLVWRIAPVLSKKDLKKLDEFKQYVNKIAEQEKGLYDEYFKTLSNADR